MTTTLVPRTSTTSRQLCFPWMERNHGTLTKLRQPRSRPVVTTKLSAPQVKFPEPVVKHSLTTRVGEARLGAVMLSLLKQYGITDEEIAAELS